MGGLREDTTVPVKGDMFGTEQKLRFHEEEGTGMIHFHDDSRKDKIKAAIPAADFWAAWRSLRKIENDQWSYIDVDNKTTLILRRIQLPPKPKGKVKTFEIVPTLEPVEIGPNFLKMNTFMPKR
jgi:hypothetical protein